VPVVALAWQNEMNDVLKGGSFQLKLDERNEIAGAERNIEFVLN